MSYQLTSCETILRIADNAFIPPDPDNRDYRKYLAWVEEGNTPEPAPEPPAPLPAPDYIAFWEALLVSSVYSSIRTQASISLPITTAVTEFIALIGDAKAGRPYESAIQNSINTILSIGSFTTAELTELQTALTASHLDSVYTLP